MASADFAEVLARLMSSARGEVSQVELSRRSGISRNVIANVEASRQAVSLDQFLRLAVAADRDPRDLITDELVDAAVADSIPLEPGLFTEHDRRVLMNVFGPASNG
jgi:transcriptional regulator with XRE-family HTH domain